MGEDNGIYGIDKRMQVDRLRDTAMRVEIFLEGSTDAIPMDTHEQLRDAADTILELREMAQKAKTENTKLRGDVERMFNASVEKNGDIARLLDENAKLEKRLAQYGLFREVVGDPAVEFANLRRELHRVERENEKLRELVHDMWDVALHPHLFGDGSYLLRRMCDLGIEADG